MRNCGGSDTVRTLEVQLQGTIASTLIRAQAWNTPVADKDWTDLGIATGRWRRQFEIENADTPTLFAIISAPVT